MNSLRRLIPLAALAAVSLLSCNGCKSSAPSVQQGTTQQANSSGPQSSSAPQQPSASQPSASSSGPAPAQPAPPPPAAVDLPTSTKIHVRLDEDLGSKISQPGDSFSATVSDDVIVNGQTVIAKGSRADGTVVDAKALGHFKGGALLEIKLDRVHTAWGNYPVETASIDRAESGKGKRSAGFIGGGAGLGAIIGGIAGGGKGAAIGALAGGGAGTAGAGLTDNKQIVLPAETALTFNLEHSVHITQTK